MAIHITLIRHGETEANIAQIWQGQGDSHLTGLGGRQAAALGSRLRGVVFDRVVGSDIGRVLETARIAGLDVDADPGWRELDVGRWEGLTRAEIAERYPEELRSLVDGKPVALGGAESWSGFGDRVLETFDRFVESLSDGERVAIVTHGGVVHSIVSEVLGFRSGRRPPWPVERVDNTSLTVVEVDVDGPRIVTYNDATHTDAEAPPWAEGPTIGLVRHGESQANVSGHWHGLTDGPLTDQGRQQAADLGAWYGGLAHVYTSHLQRARDTAALLASASRADVTVRDDAHEVDFGAWEGLSPGEIAGRFPEEWDEVCVAGTDLPRGGTGETLADAAKRMTGAVSDIGYRHPGGNVALVTHGGAIRGFMGSVVGLDHASRRRLALVENAAVSHVRIGPSGPVMVDYNLKAAIR